MCLRVIFLHVWEVSLAYFLSGCWSLSPCFLGALNRFGKLDLWDPEAPKVPQVVTSVLTFLLVVFGGRARRGLFLQSSHLYSCFLLWLLDSICSSKNFPTSKVTKKFTHVLFSTFMGFIILHWEFILGCILRLDAVDSFSLATTPVSQHLY